MISKFSLRDKFFTTLFAIVVALAAGIFLYPQEHTIFTSPRNAEVRLLFLGDMMFDRDIRRIGEQHGYNSLFEEVQSTLSEYDLVVGNLEGSITSFPSVSLGSEVGSPENTRFTFDPEIVQTLQKNNIGLVHLGNNHIFDYGRSGLLETKEWLDASSLGYFADIRDENSGAVVRDVKGQRILFVSYNEFLGNGYERVVEQIAQHKESADFLVVYDHWGVEYDANMPMYVETIAKIFIDAGADLVVGSHPHVVGDVLMYEGKSIYYSLGNFIFDQYWDESVRCGAALKVTIRSDSVQEKLVPTTFEKGRALWNECR